MEMMKDAGISVVSNQVQYSIVDRRPEIRMSRFCSENKASLLAYGTVCGGLLSERYLGTEEPAAWQLDTLSLRKYKRMIDEWGGWTLFQKLLSALDAIAKKHKAGVANVATRYILDKPAVAGVIIGARLGISDHINDNARVFDLRLDRDDFASIDDVCSGSNDLFEKIGDCGDEYR
jgi:aryl-alcohol dehydrogenase-like predicted oxidoreductase